MTRDIIAIAKPLGVAVHELHLGVVLAPHHAKQAAATMMRRTFVTRMPLLRLCGFGSRLYDCAVTSFWGFTAKVYAYAAASRQA